MKNKELIDEIISRQEIIETCVAFYGEESREYISKKFNNVKFKYAYRDELAYKVYAVFKQKYQDKGVNFEDMANRYIYMLENLAHENTIVHAGALARDASALTALGFNYKKIIRKNQDGLFEIIDGPETDKLKEFIKTHSKKKKSDQVKSINLEKRIALYNLCAKENVLASTKENLSLYKQYHEDYMKIKEYTPDKDKPFLSIENLDKQKTEFLYDFFTSKGPEALWNEKFAAYIINGFNNLFNKKYQSLQEILADPQLTMFFDFKKHYMTELVDSHVRFNKVDSMNKKVGPNNVSTSEDIVEQSNINAQYSAWNDCIEIPLSGDLNLLTILHECGHCLGSYEYEDNGKILHATGFSNQSIALTEIVNEYLTQRKIEHIDKETVHKSTIKLDDRDCAYNPGVDFMRKFLAKFEPMLKKCQTCGGDPFKIMTDFIGFQNAKNIVEIATALEVINYGKMLFSGEKEIKTISDVLKDYRKNPEKYKEYDAIIKNFDKMYKFMDEMVEKYAEFEQGKITDIEMQTNWQRSQTQQEELAIEN